MRKYSVWFASIFLTVFLVQASTYSKWRDTIRAAQEAFSRRDFQKARELLEASAPVAAELGPESSAENSSMLANAYSMLNLDADSLKTLEGAITKIGPSPASPKLQYSRAMLLYDYARELYYIQEFDKSMTNAVGAINILEGMGVKGVAEMFFLYSMIGDIHQARTNYSEAEVAFKRALNIAMHDTRVLGTRYSGPQEQVVNYVYRAPARGKVDATVSLGKLYSLQKRYDDAEKILLDSLSFAEAGFGKKGEYTVVSLVPLSLVELELNKRQEFEKYSDRIYEFVSKKPGFRGSAQEPFWKHLEMDVNAADSAAAAQSAKRVAKVIATQNLEPLSLPEQAVTMIQTNQPIDWKRARLIQESISQAANAQYATNPAIAAKIQLEFVKFATQNERPELLQPALENVIQFAEKAKDQTLLLSAYGKMAEMRLAENKPADALPYLHKSSEILSAKYGDDTRTADGLDKEAALLKTLGREKESADLQAKAVEVRNKAFAK